MDFYSLRTRIVRILVLGVGNILLSDEGIGPRAIEALRARPWPAAVELLDGGTSAMELLDDMAGRDLLILVDCVRAGRAPGEMLRLVDEEIPALFRTKLSPHQVGLPDVLATLRITGEAPRRIVLFGVEPASLDTAMTLTPLVAARLPELVTAISEEITAALANAGDGSAA